MSRHNRHRAFEAEQHQADQRDRVRAESLRAMDELDKERRIHQQQQLLTSAESIHLLNSKRRRIRGKAGDRIIRQATVCLMPDCAQDTVHLMGESLGVCYGHASRINDYFNIVGEDFENNLAKLGRIEAEAKRQRKEERAAEARLHSPGWIYYLLLGDRIKIGYSKDVKRRLTAYPFDSPLLAMHPGTKQLESEMHAKFAGSRIAGREYFLDTEELRRHIAEVIDQFGEPDRARYERRGQRANRNLKAS